jgi:hypothetical protein
LQSSVIGIQHALLANTHVHMIRWRSVNISQHGAHTIAQKRKKRDNARSVLIA